MEIESKLKKYQVIFEADLDFIQELLREKNAFFVIDRIVYDLYETYFSSLDRECLYVLEATEENKVIDTALAICECMTGIPAKRNATLISVGGGIIQDITGFVANIMYRGIRWIFVPTTLLASCDSCIGGKTSLNYKKYKNLLGTFYPPDQIRICPLFFSTLSEKDYKSGLGEVIKFNIMAGSERMAVMESSLLQLLNREAGVVNRFVETSLLFKKSFIEQDEFDRGERIKLNFAHTFGHAIEVVSVYKIPHGTAVAIGMIIANHIARCRGWIDENVCRRSEKLLLPVIDIDIALLEKPFGKYMEAIRKDKKQVGDSLTAVLIRKYKETATLEVVHDVTEEEIRQAIMYFIELYKTN